MTKREPMTVREADEYLDEMIHQGSQPHECPRYRQARAIITAAVEFIEARVAYECGDISDFRDAFALQVNRDAAWKKLRALERGESEGKP